MSFRALVFGVFALVTVVSASPTILRGLLQEQAVSVSKFELPPSASDNPAENPLTAEQQARRDRLARCLGIYHTKKVDADRLRPWSIMHGLIAYGDKTQIIVQGQSVDAVEYLCSNGIGNGMRLMYLDNGKLATRQGQGVQGHEGQLLAMLAQSSVPPTYPISIEGNKFTVADLIEYEKRGCRSHSELTFKLISLAYYLDPEAAWTNEKGESWSMARLITEELQAPVNEGACGGTHRLSSLCYAVEQKLKSGQPLDGPWLAAAQAVDGYVELTWKNQNPDGSFSTDWFKGPGADPDSRRRLYTTGHILEWLALALPAERMDDPRVTAAVDYLLNLMLRAPGYELDVGPRGHALHALAMYEKKAFGQSSNYGDLVMTEDELATASAKPKVQPVSSVYSGEQGSDNSGRRVPTQGFFRRR